MKNDIKKYDNLFLESNFISRVDHIIMLLINGISVRNLNNVKHYLSNDVYNKFNNLITDYKDKKVFRKFDEANIKSSEILSYSIDNDIINIKVNVITRYMDYFVNENNEYIDGIDDQRVERSNIVTFSKKLVNLDSNNIIRCKNCGNSLDINSTNICKYCNSKIDIIDYDYIITDISLF